MEDWRVIYGMVVLFECQVSVWTLFPTLDSQLVGVPTSTAQLGWPRLIGINNKFYTFYVFIFFVLIISSILDYVKMTFCLICMKVNDVKKIDKSTATCAVGLAQQWTNPPPLQLCQRLEFESHELYLAAFLSLFSLGQCNVGILVFEGKKKATGRTKAVIFIQLKTELILWSYIILGLNMFGLGWTDSPAHGH